MTSATDRIEKKILLRAPRSRVWRALTDIKEFGRWFGVNCSEVNGQRATGAFTPGTLVRGQITHTNYEHLTWEVVVERVEPEHLFSWRWHPYAVEPGADYSGEEKTLVVFELEEVKDGTLLAVVESGFDKVPLARRAKAFQMNEGGWEWQMKSIESHVSKAA